MWKVKKYNTMNDKLKPDSGTQRSPASVPEKMGQTPDDRTVFRSSATNQSAGQTRVKQVPPNQPLDATRIKPAGAEGSSSQPTGGIHSGQVSRQNVPMPDATRMQQRESTAHSRSQGNSNQTGAHPQIHQAGTAQENHVLKGRFVLDKVIGVGGMGVVYKATDKLKVEAHDREPYVAIKVLSEEFKSHPESFIALQRESRKTQRISHPNVVKVYDFDRDGDVVFMTMEYMEGRPLDQIIKQYSSLGLPKDDVWSILNGLCSALIYAHAENIVHSDFKPGNIFITDAGYPKIFDFGIARAVATVDRQSGKQQDRTVFDAGSLGALTPAYASLEMLLGKAPDFRDDLFALGCIAYEMLTGEHPYKRIPADEAYKSRMKPAKIPGIKARQWRAIEKALAFTREDRLASVVEFYQLIQPKRRSLALLFASVVVIAAITTVVLVLENTRAPAPAPAPQQTNELHLDEIEFKIRYDLFKEKIDKLVADPRFSQDWESSLWDEVNGMSLLLGNRRDDWIGSMRGVIYRLYQQKCQELLQEKNYSRASAILGNAGRYTDDPSWIAEQMQRLADLERREAERQSAALAEQQRAREVHEAQVRAEESRDNMFDLALRNVNQQLQCQNRLNMRDFSIAVDKLRATDSARYAKLESNIILKVSECITQVGRTQPEQALEAKNYALRIFDNNRLIAAINIVSRDACDRSIAGLGARGDRAICRDDLSSGGTGPAMIVTPDSSAIPTFAIGKYEVSIREFKQYCQATGECSVISSSDDALPIVNISISQANGYVRWLSSVAQQKYRLPTHTEWMYAANTTNQSHDPNRNCQLNSRGIEKGGKLVRANTGMQNSWGLVNYLGNAQEWVYDKSRNLHAVGGSFEDPMEQCDVTTTAKHAGEADMRTGFRILRELAR